MSEKNDGPSPTKEVVVIVGGFLVVLVVVLLPFTLSGTVGSAAALGMFALLLVVLLVGAGVNSWRRWMAVCPQCGYRQIRGIRGPPDVCARCGSALKAAGLEE
jgi:cell division protein FtsW (lipid II flippase)